MAAAREAGSLRPLLPHHGLVWSRGLGGGKRAAAKIVAGLTD